MIKGKDKDDFEKAIMEDVDDVTGAMHQCAVIHAVYIAKNGYGKWCEELSEARKKKGESQKEYEYNKEFALV